jgi:5'(3')-deoxyribonucleotidase
MSEQLWIAVDVDGVLADQVGQILPVLERQFGYRANRADITKWDFPLGSSSFGAILRNQQKDPSFILDTPLIPGAREGMEKLSKSYSLAIVTARPRESIESTIKWLNSNRIPYSAFANLCEGEKHKTVDPCRVLIDDYQINVLEFLRNTHHGAILFSQPWNASSRDLDDYFALNRATRAESWEHVPEMVARILNANNGDS